MIELEKYVEAIAESRPAVFSDEIQIAFWRFDQTVKDGANVWILVFPTNSEIQAEYAPIDCINARFAVVEKRRKRFRYRVWLEDMPLTNLIVKLQTEIVAYGKKFKVWTWARCSGGRGDERGIYFFSFVDPSEKVEIDCTTENALLVLRQTAAIELRSEKEGV